MRRGAKALRGAVAAGEQRRAARASVSQSHRFYIHSRWPRNIYLLISSARCLQNNATMKFWRTAQVRLRHPLCLRPHSGARASTRGFAPRRELPRTARCARPRQRRRRRAPPRPRARAARAAGRPGASSPLGSARRNRPPRASRGRAAPPTRASAARSRRQGRSGEVEGWEIEGWPGWAAVCVCEWQASGCKGNGTSIAK